VSTRNLSLLRKKIPRLPLRLRPAARQVCSSRGELMRRFRSTLGQGVHAQRIRCHGDYHLGQVLSTGKDFFIIDFEGEPARELAERRLKHSPLRDVAGMLRSFHYAAHAALQREIKERGIRPENKRNAAAWANHWHAQVSALFLKEYFKVARGASFLPERSEEASRLLEIHLLEKAVYELGYELNHRPGWVGIPLQGILRLLSPA
jgi:maltose alpha-D-glucosyltransferase/alpha-amylase